jgi:hypothetical protein
MKPMRLIITTVALGMLVQPAMAFQQTTTGVGAQEPAAATDSAAPAKPAEQGKGLNLSVPGKSTGTEVRIPGIGTVGVLPKLDFGLELLYGANGSNDSKMMPDDKGDSNDVQIRGTIKHRF